MRPKLRNDTAFLPTQDGVLLRNNEAMLALKGRQVYRLLSTLAPYLTGERTVAQFCDGLDEQHRQMVSRLVDTLVTRGFAKDCAADPVDESQLSNSVREQFAAQINFLDHVADRPLARFARFQQARVLAVGGGESLAGLAESLLDNGLAGLDVVGSVPDGLPNRAQTVSAPDVAGYDLVVYCADESSPRAAMDLNARCVASGTRLLPMTVLGTHAVVGPLVESPTGPCWLCAHIRLTTNVEPRTAAQFWCEASLGTSAPVAGNRVPNPMAGSVARMLAGALGFEAFQALAGLRCDVTGAIVVSDVHTLVTEREQILPHPHCPVCAPNQNPAPPGDNVSGDEQPGEDVPAEERYERLVGRHAGVISEYADDDRHQVPLKVAVARGGGREAVAFDLHSVHGARLAAAKELVRRYTLAGPGCTVAGSPRELALAGRLPVAEPDVLTWTGVETGRPDEVIAWLPATSLVDGRRRWVPAAAVHPDSPLNGHARFQRTPAGSAVGLSEREVADAGLDSMLGYRRLCDLVGGRALAIPLANSHVAGTDRQLAFLLDSAGHLGRDTVLLEVVAADPVHVVIALVAGDGPVVWGVGAARSGPDAATFALRDAVGRVQTLRFESGGADLDETLLVGADLDETLLADFDPGADLPRGAAADSRFTAAPATTGQILDHLRVTGADALLVDTTPPDIRSVGLVAGRVICVTT